ncbi:SLC13 family permease [Fodinicurvata fenggangensis]|uniref:SLC13 family permease n=1 Tax=Fodinicurvata fenggangensis TaxID=1121830 RepID=UPI00047A5DF1|nr:SLC13 family permease [Fodinicurvata fenggangensis]
MTLEQGLVLGILGCAMALFIWGRWRYDVVALMALLSAVLAGLIPMDEAFSGFSHPAVITVAAILILSRMLSLSGAVDILARHVIPARGSPTLMIGACCILAAVLSAFMNNVGALALLIPITLQAAAKSNIPPSRFLMPVSFASILGGMTTLIGTPPNIIVASYRAGAEGSSFSMFDFTPVGATLMLAGVSFVVLVGWRLLPKSRDGAHAGQNLFENIASYVTEARVTEDAKAKGKRLIEIERELDELEAVVIAVVRNNQRILAPHRYQRIQEGDVLILEADPEGLAKSIPTLGLELVGERSDDDHDSELKSEDTVQEDGEGIEAQNLQSEEVKLIEVVILPNSRLIGSTAKGLRLRNRFGINLLAISRQGSTSGERLRSTVFAAGDVLLLQGEEDRIASFTNSFGCAPLGKREIKLPHFKEAMKAGALMVGAAAFAASGLVSAAVAFVTAAVLAVILRILPVRETYEALDGSVIVLLAALIPVANAVGSSGAAELIAETLVNDLAGGDPVLTLGLLLVVTMLLTDFMNNAATAAVMSPIAISLASQLSVNTDTFLMAVAVGASSAFLTPIGHQNNTLILGPGGYRFSDYWRMGLPLDIVIVSIAIPMLLLVWPL